MKMRLLFLASFFFSQVVVASSDDILSKVEKYKKDFEIMAASREGYSFFIEYQPADEEALVREMKEKLHGKSNLCKRFFSVLAGTSKSADRNKKDEVENDHDGFVEIASQVIDQARLDSLVKRVKSSRHLRSQAEITKEMRKRNYLAATVRFFGCGKLCCLKSNFAAKKQR